ncbi:MAG: AAA family ATPase [Phototrophicaceae bacterium]
MLTKMSMTNFKSWAQTGDIRLAPLTAFFGTNSSGKSSLLHMLLLLKQTAESSDRNLPLKTGSPRDYVNLGTAYEMTHRNAPNLQMGLEWDFAESESIQVPDVHSPFTLNKLEFRTHIEVAQTQVQVRSIEYRHADLFSALLEKSAHPSEAYRFDVTINGNKAKRSKGRPSMGIKPNKCYGFSDEAMSYYQKTEYLEDVVLRFEQQLQRLHYLGPLREYPERTYVWGGERPENVDRKGELTISALLAAQTTDVYNGTTERKTVTLHQRIAQWLKELDLADSFEIRPLVKGSVNYEVRLKRNADSPEVLLTDLGIGVSQILPVLVLCYYVPQGSTIILEQPELHLHPSVQSRLADVLIDVVTNRNVQIIVESHSEHLLKRLQRRIAEQNLPNRDVALYYCDLHEGASRLTALEVDAFGAVHNYPRDFFGDMIGDMVATMEAGLNAREQNHAP